VIEGRICDRIEECREEGYKRKEIYVIRVVCKEKKM
jgi:hypothetical protein